MKANGYETTDLGMAVVAVAAKMCNRHDHSHRDEEATERRRNQVKLWKDYVGAIGPRYRDCRLENFAIDDDSRQRLALGALRAYADDLPANLAAGRGIVLVGPCGVGKDHLLAGLARRACELGTGVEWVSGPALFGSIRDGFDGDRSEAETMRRFITAPVLHLSDPMPPSRQLTDFQADLLYRLVDARYRALRPTWASLNLAVGEADRTLGSQVADRLRDGALVLRCDWPSHRRPFDGGKPA